MFWYYSGDFSGFNNKSSDEPPIRENSLEYVNDADESNSIVGPLNAYKSHAAQRLYKTNASLPMDNAIKRIRSGHRRLFYKYASYR